MKILVTGVNGFFGKNVYKYLQDKLYGVDLYGIGRNNNPNQNYTICDIKCETTVKDYLNTLKPDVIVHLAANPRGNADLSAMDDNVKGTHNLVHYAPLGCQFIFASTIVVYGKYNQFNFIEDMTPKPTSLYALSKLNAENIINRYALLGKIKKVNYRYCAMVGKDLSHGFIFDLLRKINSNYEKLELIGDKPGSIKPFLHVQDACRTIRFAIEKQLEGTYNVCPNDNISVLDIAKLAMNTFNIQKDIVWNPSQVWEGDNLEIKGGNCKLYSKNFEFKYKTSKHAIAEAFNEIITTNK